MMSREKKKQDQQTNNEADEVVSRRVVLVGTYKGDQLTRWRGWYNYPIGDDDFSCKGRKGGRAGSPLPADLSRINELWLFQGTSGQKKYKAEFVGVKTREELIRDYGYPAGNGGRGTVNGRAGAPRAPKPHGDRYALFKTQFIYPHGDAVPEDAESVIIRLKDFARSPKVRKQLKAYLESSDRKDPDLAKRLPEIIVKLRPEQLRVCEAAVQIELFSRDKLQPVHLPKQGVFTAVELFAGAGGLSIGLERAGIHAVIVNEIMPDFAATLAANHPDTDVVTEAIYILEAA